MSQLTGLFEESSPFLPWLPDETLFSLCSRLHRLWGFHDAGKTAEILFGARRAGLHHDFPNRLRQFETRTSGRYGVARELAEGRTLLRYYRPFLPEPLLSSAARTMGGESVAHLKFRLGLLTSRFRANHPLKACTTCMAVDLAVHGWVYWHRAHQYPGVWTCAEHGTLLRESNIKATGVGRFQWHLPDEITLIAAPVLAQADSVRRMSQLSATVADVIASEVAPGALQLENVRRTLLARAACRGWVTSAGRLRMGPAADDYLAYCEPLSMWPELSGLPKNAKAASNQLGMIFHLSSRSAHPLRLMLAIDWLFGSAQAFFAAHGSTAAEADIVDCGGGRRDEASRDNEKAELVRLIRTGSSISAAAKQVGVAVETAMAWAAAVGVVTIRRPKRLVGDAAECLMRELADGAGKQQLAQRYGISVETVTRVLRTQPGLQATWHEKRFDRARESARAAWLNACEGASRVGVKLLRAQEPAAYAWLYRNDRAWLGDHTPPNLPRAAGHRGDAARWDERDAALSDAVKRAALRLHNSSPSKQLKLWQIYQAVPELKAKLRRLDRLPLTQRALESALAKTSRQEGDLFK